MRSVQTRCVHGSTQLTVTHILGANPPCFNPSGRGSRCVFLAPCLISFLRIRQNKYKPFTIDNAHASGLHFWCPLVACVGLAFVACLASALVPCGLRTLAVRPCWAAASGLGRPLRIRRFFPWRPKIRPLGLSCRLGFSLARLGLPILAVSRPLAGFGRAWCTSIHTSPETAKNRAFSAAVSACPIIRAKIGGGLRALRAGGL